MNDDQIDGLNVSTYWRDRNEQESKEKRQESKIMMRELMKWWEEKDLWAEFIKSYPQRFAIALHKASILEKVEYLSDTKVFRFDVDGNYVEMAVDVCPRPDWSLKDTFENLEKTFINR